MPIFGFSRDGAQWIPLDKTIRWIKTAKNIFRRWAQGKKQFLPRCTSAETSFRAVVTTSTVWLWSASESKFLSWASAAAKNVSYLWGEGHVPTFQAVKQARKLSQFHVTVPEAKEV